MRTRSVPRKGTYGVDAPYLLPIPGLLIVLNLFEGVRTGAAPPYIAAALVAACIGFGLHAIVEGGAGLLVRRD